MTQILITQHGNHSPEKWAVATAQMIFPVYESDLSGEKLLEAKRKELELIELLTKHHAWHQNDEKAKLVENPEHVLSPLSHDPSSITSKIVEMMHGTSWQEHFTHPDVQQAVADTLKSHTMTNRYTERSWHADRNHKTCNFAHAFTEMR
jgi:hypothetical protein